METVTGFRTPEEAALDLELALLGALVPPPHTDGPVAAAWPKDDFLRHDVGHVAERALSSALADEGCLGVIGDVSPSRRAAVAAALAAAVAGERNAVLVDADLRHAHLSFDDRRRAQEGLVDVLRYGVRSPRVVAPTSTPGLALLPVGSRTVDFPGTFGADAAPALFAELRRGGEFLIVNGPDLVDAEGATPFLDQIPGWVLILELGTSDPERMRALRDRFGKDRCVGIVTLAEPRTVTAASRSATEDRPTSEEELPWEETSPSAPSAPGDVVREVEAAMAAQDREKATAPRLDVPTPLRLRRPRGLLVGIVGVLLLAILGALFFGPKDGQRGTRSERQQARGTESPAPDKPAPTTSLESQTPSLEPRTPSLEPQGTALDPQTKPPGSESPSTESGASAPGAAAQGSAAQGSAAPGASTPSSGTSLPPASQTSLGERLLSPEGQSTPAGRPSTSGSLTQPADRTSEPTVPAERRPEPPATSDRAVASSPPRPTTPPSAAPTGSTAPAGAARAPLGEVVWGVHVSSVKDRDGALGEAKRLAVGDRKTFVKETEVPGKGTWWRVYVGPFGARAEAERVAASLRGSGEDAQVYRLARAEVEAGLGREDR